MTGLEVLNLLMDIMMDIVHNSPITTNPTVIFLTLFSVIPPYAVHMDYARFVRSEYPLLLASTRTDAISRAFPAFLSAVHSY